MTKQFLKDFNPAKGQNFRRLEHGTPEYAAWLAGMRHNPVVRDIGYEGPWMVYDRLTAAAGATTATGLRFFTTPISATKTKNDTNLIKQSEMPSPERIKILSLRFSFSPAMHPTDIRLFLTTYYTELFISERIYVEGPLALFPGGTGISTASTAPASSGIPDPRAIYVFGDKGPEIGQGENFYAVCTGTAFVLQAASNGGGGQDILAVMDVIRVRAVA